MKKSRFTEAQIIAVLRQAEGGGITMRQPAGKWSKNIWMLSAGNWCGSASKKPFDIKGPNIPALLAKALK
jgi:hypothetical protein